MDQDFSKGVIKTGGGDLACHNTIVQLKVVLGHLQTSSPIHRSPTECQKLAAHATTVFDTISAEALNIASSDMLRQLGTLEHMVDQLVCILDELSSESKLKNILWREVIASQIDGVYEQLSMAVQLSNLGKRLNFGRFQQEREAARNSDTAHLGAALEEMNHNAYKIIEFLGVEKPQMKEAMMAIQRSLDSIGNTPEKQLLEQGMHAMQRLSRGSKPDPDPSVITSLDVIIHHDRKLGTGGFAQAFEGTWQSTTVAVKQFDRTVPPLIFQREVDIWKRLRHPNIVEFFGACPIADPPFSVCALKSNRDAISYLLNHPAADRRKLIYEASLGLQYLHCSAVIHGDLKASNILIDDNGTACLSDFGLSKIRLHTTTDVPAASHPQGSAPWMSPEQMSTGGISRASDIYSFGMTMYEIFSGEPPFAYMPTDLLRINVVERQARPPRRAGAITIRRGLDDMMWGLIEECWSHVAAARPKAASVATRLDAIRSNPTPSDFAAIPDNAVSSTDGPVAGEGMRQITNQDIIIAVMGSTGSGKSSFINAATGQTSAMIGHGLGSCTQDVHAVRCSHPTLNGRNVVFVDTPGFDDSDRHDYDVLKAIADWLKQTYMQDITLTGILYFHRISDTRMRGTPLRNLAMFEELCGADALQNVILTTSMWDSVAGALGDQREEELRRDFWQPMIAAGCRMTRFHASHESAWATVGLFDLGRPTRGLKVQREMVDEGKALSKTSAYAVLLGWWERVIARFRGEGKRDGRASKQKDAATAKDKDERVSVDGNRDFDIALRQRARLLAGDQLEHSGPPAPTVVLQTHKVPRRGANSDGAGRTSWVRRFNL